MWVWLVWQFGHNATSLPARVLYRLLDLVVVRMIAGARIPAGVTFGKRIALLHDAMGIVINPVAVIGDDVRIYHQVTIGESGTRLGSPVIGDRVVIGAGAKLLGPITVGDGAKIGANAVVTSDVPAGAVVVGAQARIIVPQP